MRHEHREAALDLLRTGHGFAILGEVPIGYVDAYYHIDGWDTLPPWNELEEKGIAPRIVIGNYRNGKVVCTADVRSHGFYDGMCVLTGAFGRATFEQLQTIAHALGCDFERRVMVWCGGRDRPFTEGLIPSAHGRGPWHRPGAKTFTEKLIRQRLDPREVMVRDHEITFYGVAKEAEDDLLEEITWLWNNTAVGCHPAAGIAVTPALKAALTEAYHAARSGDWPLFHALCYTHKFVGGLDDDGLFGEYDPRSDGGVYVRLDGLYFASATMGNGPVDPEHSPTLTLLEEEHARYYDCPPPWRR